MSVPAPIGKIHYDEPRAVMVRNPENLNEHHSAVHCGINIYTDNKKETDTILKNWSNIMEELDRIVADCLAFEDEG